MSDNIYTLFASRFRDHLDVPFLRIPDGKTYTYGEIERRSGAMAAVLADAGATPGDCVVVQVDKSADAIALYFACLRGGYVYVPLNTAYMPEEVGFFLGDAVPAVFVCKPEHASTHGPVADVAGVPRSLTLGSEGNGTLADAAAGATALETIVARGSDDVACMVYTSGTTGRSKGAMLTHGGITANAKALHTIWGFRPGDVLLHSLPVFHIHGLFVALHCALLNASEVLFLSKFDVEQVRASLPHATVMMGVPTHYIRLLADPEFSAGECESVRLFTSGSAPLSEAVFHAFATRVGHTICERYGMTETGIIASNPLEGERLAGTVGYALPAMEMRIADARDEAVAAGETGEVQVRGPHVFPGYWGLRNKTAQAHTADGFFRTGDVGSIAADGRLTLAGRSTDVIISGGYNVYPKEIELLLDLQPGVTESAIVGLRHPEFGEAVVAFVVANAEVTDDALTKALADKLANYKRPKRYVFLDSLPRNAMGKVQKAKLRAKYADLFGLADR